jgi:hypothetical protein
MLHGPISPEPSGEIGLLSAPSRRSSCLTEPGPNADQAIFTAVPLTVTIIIPLFSPSTS